MFFFFLFNALCCGLAVTRPSNIRHKRSSGKESNCSIEVSLGTDHGNMLQINYERGRRPSEFSLNMRIFSS